MLHCDFCYAEVKPGKATRIYAKDFDQYVLPPEGQVRIGDIEIRGIRSLGDWCACPDCIVLIRANDWDALVEKVVKIESAHGLPAPVVREFLRVSWANLRKNLEVIQ